MFEEDEEKVPLWDWMFRYFKLWFDYWGQLGLFDKAAQVVDDSGVDTNISTVRMKMELANSLTAGSDLKAFVHHYVPASLLFYPKG